MKEARLYKSLSEKKVQCLNCAHKCILPPGQTGICGVRKNIGGKLYSLVYGKAVAVNIDPIEKKPLFHFLPRTYSLSIATVGCQFRCWNCQNWEISQGPKITGKIEGEDISPEQIVAIAKKHQLPSISYTYTDPIVFSEYALDTMKLAKKGGIKNCWITSGFFSKELLSAVSPYLDAANVDLKYFSDKDYIKYSGGRLQPVLDTLKGLKRKKVWVEVTTLIIPTINDSEKTLKGIAKFIKEELGAETPWHTTQFSSALSWKLHNIPNTPIETLIKARQIGQKQGLKYVYTGNVPGLEGENTYCPKCGTLVIQRYGYNVKRYDKNGKCPKCGASINLIER
ncbi:AmmeMemoRadiSam system radical SAM enzyme [bacterium]|nr:AmmeMemoRadiSam system radical SAM enzyme [bacterium]